MPRFDASTGISTDSRSVSIPGRSLTNVHTGLPADNGSQISTSRRLRGKKDDDNMFLRENSQDTQSQEQEQQQQQQQQQHLQVYIRVENVFMVNDEDYSLSSASSLPSSLDDQECFYFEDSFVAAFDEISDRSEHADEKGTKLGAEQTTKSLSLDSFNVEHEKRYKGSTDLVQDTKTSTKDNIWKRFFGSNQDYDNGEKNTPSDDSADAVWVLDVWALMEVSCLDCSVTQDSELLHRLEKKLCEQLRQGQLETFENVRNCHIEISSIA